MKMRTTALTLVAALAAGCSSSSLLPSTGAGTAAAWTGSVAPDGSDVPALVRIRIPRRAGRRPERHPSTISPFTRSVSIAVNTAKAQVFNTTPSSPGCAAGVTGTTCTFAVHAKAGTDTFTVTTYGGANATGTALDRGIAAKVTIAKGKANHVSVTLGPLVTSVADSGAGSLRYAIGSANNGDTIVFALPSGSTITLASPISLLGSKLTIAGPGAANLAISGGGTHEIFTNAGILTISGLTLTHGNAQSGTNPGGAINNAGSLTLIDDFVGSSASAASLKRRPRPAFASLLRRRHPHCTTTTAEGGAIYNNGTLVTTGTTFSGNVVNSDSATCVVGTGGAIFNDTNGTVNSTKDTFEYNSAQAGGAVYNVGIGQVTFTNDTFTGNTGCTAKNGCPTAYLGEGAAIADDGSGVNVIDSTFTNNVAGGTGKPSSGVGGALLLGAGTPSITGSTFSGNLAGGGTTQCSVGEGGAIATAIALELDNDTFQNNQAIGDQEAAGGAVFGATASATISGSTDTFTKNAVNGPGSACSANSEGIGGAVATQATATFEKTSFTGNTATANAMGGGGAMVCGTCALVSDTFTSNAAIGTGANGPSSSGAGGGAVFAQTLVKAQSSTFTSNSATAKTALAQEAGGGAILSTSSLVLSGNTFTSNSAVIVSGGTAAGAVGGALADTQTSGTVDSTGDKYTSNTASGGANGFGGAMYVEGPYSINNGTFSSNSVHGTQAAGGALGLGTHSGKLINDVFSGNSAIAPAGDLGGGGAISDNGGATIDGGKVTGNTASMLGGGILASGSTAEGMIGVTVSGNVVTNASVTSTGGGGVYDESGLLMLNSTISGNTVTVSGSGFGGGGMVNYGGLLASGSTISANKVLGTTVAGGGGGILSTSGLELENSTVAGNSSSVDGGGILSGSGSSVGLTNVTVYENSATGRGGNLDNVNSATLTNSILAGGKATAGGPDAYNTGTITSDGWNILQTAVAGSGSFTTATGDLQLTNPKLLPLANNGGPTFTNADQATSPGAGRIPYSGGCGNGGLTADQRGYQRGAAHSGTTCDVGAYEYAGTVPAIARRPALPKHTFRHRDTLGIPLPHLAPMKLKIDL